MIEENKDDKHKDQPIEIVEDIENNDSTPPFKVGKEGVDYFIQKYLNRKFTEELDYIDKHGGIRFFEEGLYTSIANGLIDKTSEDKDLRIEVFDSNEKAADEEISFWTFVWEALQDPIIRILIIAAIISTILGVTTGNHPEKDWVDGIAIILAVVVVTLVGSINNYNKETEFRKLKQMDENERFVNIRRNGGWEKCKEETLLVGDIMQLESGKVLTCECLVIEGFAEMDESAMTGEIDLISKGTFESCWEKKLEVAAKKEKKGIPVSHHDVESPIIISGTQVESGDGAVLILTVGPNTESGKIKASVDANKSSVEGTPLQMKLNDLAEKIGYMGLISAVITMVGMSLNLAIRAGIGEFIYSSEDSRLIVNIFIIPIIVVVVAIPEGLPLAVTMTLAFSIGKMLKDNNFVRRMESCETMGNAEFVCTDKTGTLTKNEMQVTKYYNCIKEYDFEETVGDKWTGNPLDKFGSAKEWEIFKTILACNTTTTFDKDGKESGNKSDESLTKLLKKFGVDVKKTREELVQKIGDARPQNIFNSKRKKMSTVITDESNCKKVLLKGASEIIIDSCTHYYNFSGERVDLDEHSRNNFYRKIKEYASLTFRTFCIAVKEVCHEEAEAWNEEAEAWNEEGVTDKGKKTKVIEEDGYTLVGVIGIKDHMKEGVQKAIEDCKRAGIKVIMITGDNIDTAIAIANSCGIAEDRKQAILGDVFMDKIGGIVCFNCSTEEKPKEEVATKLLNKKKECICPKTKEEWCLKYKRDIRQKKFKENPTKYAELQNDKKATKKFEKELDEESFKQFAEQKIKVRQDAIANIEAFKEIIINLKVIARSQPSHKYALVTGLKQIDHIVSVTGDGTNDAQALSKADVGFAMDNGTDIAKEASDIVIRDNQFSTIVKGIKWGRNIYDNIRRFLQFQLSVNICACILVMIGASVGQESPLTALQMLWVNMIMDSLGSLALSTEKPTEQLLDRPPNGRADFIINRKMAKHIVGQSVFQLIILFVLLFSAHTWLLEYTPEFQDQAYLLKRCYSVYDSSDVPIYHTGELEPKNMYVISGLESFFSNSTNVSYPLGMESICGENFDDSTTIKRAYKIFKGNYYATTHYTILFNTFVFCQLFNELCCRVIDDGWNFLTRINTNIMFLLIWAIEVFAQVIIVLFTGPVFNVSFGGLSGEHWVICLGFAFLTFPVNFILKLLPDPYTTRTEDKEQGKSMQKEGLVGSIRGGSFARKNSIRKDPSKNQM